MAKRRKVQLNVVPIRPPVNQTCVELVRDMLGDAERGDITAVAYIAVRPNGATRMGKSADISSDLVRALGALAILQRDLLDEVRQWDRPVERPDDPA